MEWKERRSGMKWNRNEAYPRGVCEDFAFYSLKLGSHCRFLAAGVT